MERFWSLFGHSYCISCKIWVSSALFDTVVVGFRLVFGAYRDAPNPKNHAPVHTGARILKNHRSALELLLASCFASLGALLGPSWALLGRSWALLGRSWAVFGLSWAVLRRSWAGLGVLLGGLGSLLGGFGAVIGGLGWS